MNDTMIKQVVEHELEWAPGIEANEIGVSVDGGVVTLGGHVPTYAQKVTAQHAVTRLKAVRGLVDRLEVRLGTPADDDEALARRAANLLEWDATVPAGAAKVTVADGQVTISGEVAWQYQRIAAENALHRLKGVRGVINEIRVRPLLEADDIQKRIEKALERQIDLDANHVVVTVDGDTVRLDGSVHAWFEKDAIETAAWSAPGVRAVDDRIRVG